MSLFSKIYNIFNKPEIESKDIEVREKFLDVKPESIVIGSDSRVVNFRVYDGENNPGEMGADVEIVPKRDALSRRAKELVMTTPAFDTLIVRG